MGMSRALAPAIMAASVATNAMAEQPTTPADCATAIQQMSVAPDSTVVCGYATVDTVQPEESTSEVDQPFDVVTLHITAQRDAMAGAATDLRLGCKDGDDVWHWGAMDQVTGQHAVEQVTSAGALLNASAQKPMPVLLQPGDYGDFGGECISEAGRVFALTAWLEALQTTEFISTQVASIQAAYNKGLEDLTLTIEQLETMREELAQLKTLAMADYAANRGAVRQIDDLTGKVTHLRLILMTSATTPQE